MATYVFDTAPIYVPIRFDLHNDVLQFGELLTAAQIFPHDDSDQGEILFFNDARLVMLRLDQYDASRFSPANFQFANGSLILVGDQTFAWRDDALDNTLTGSTQGDLIAGLGGNDIIVAGGGDDAILLYPGEGDTVGTDNINGGDGNDTLFLPHELIDEDENVSSVNLTSGVVDLAAMGGATLVSIEHVIGTQSRDVITGNGLANLLAGRDEEDTLKGEGGNDTLVGGEGNDSLDGGAGNDLLRGQAGRDTLNGGAGDDTIAGTGLRFDTLPDGTSLIDGGLGNDVILVPVSFSLGTVKGVEKVQLTGGAGANLAGNSAANYLVGNANGNQFTGGAGNDTFEGGGGVFDIANYQGTTAPLTVSLANGGNGTVVSATEGTDTLIDVSFVLGSTANDTMIGGEGTQRFRGNQGADSLVGGAGFDELSYFNSPEQVFVNLGTNVLEVFVNGAQTSLFGGRAFDGWDANSTMEGVQFSTDTIVGFEHATGGTNRDLLVGSDEDNSLWGAGGNDTLAGGKGNDTLDGFVVVEGQIATQPMVQDGANDEISYRFSTLGVHVDFRLGFARDGTEDLSGNATLEASLDGVLEGNGYLDTIRNVEAVRGGSGNDTLKGDDGHFQVLGSAHLDEFERFEGGEGNDLIDGGGGNAGFIDIASYANDQVLDGRGVAVNLGSGPVELFTATGGIFENQTLEGGTARDGWGGIDTLSNIDYVWGSQGHDYLRGGGNSLNYLGDPFENFQGFGGNDTIDGGADNDRADYASAPNGIVATADSIPGHWSVNDGYGTVDTLLNIEGIRGGRFDDTFIGSFGDEFFEGMQGNDSIDGNLGTDSASYRFSTSGVFVDLQNGFANDGMGGIDTLVGIENAVGSDFGDRFIGNEQQENRFDGRLGMRVDPFTGSGIGVYQDTVDYSSHEEAIEARLEQGQVLNANGESSDTLVDIEVIIGTSQDDWIHGSNTAEEYAGLFTDRTERYIGGAGNDTLDGGEGGEDGDIDIVQYESPVVVNLGLTGRSYDSSFFFGFIDAQSADEAGPLDGFPSGVDVLRNIDGVIGSGGSDLLFGGSESRAFNGQKLEIFAPGGGNDTVAGFDGFDFVTYQGRTDAGVEVVLDSNVGGFAGLLFDGGWQHQGVAVFYTFNQNGQRVETGEVDLLFDIDGVRGTQLNDTLRGGQGSFELGNRMVFEGNRGDDIIDGGDARAVSSYRSSPTAVYVDLGRGFALDGWGNTDFLNGVSGARGSDFDDTLIGGGSHNIGQDAWQESFEGGAGNDVIDGGDDADIPRIPGEVDHGIDILEYHNAPGAVFVDLGAGTAQDGYGTTDTFVGIEGVRGSKFGDTLIGSDREFEVFTGGAGSDIIQGGEGIDMLDHDFEPDGVVVNLGSEDIEIDGETIAGGTVRDAWGDIDVVTGIEWVLGTTHDDTIVGSDGDNYLEGLEGDDVIRGGAGNDTLFGDDDGQDIADYGNSTMGVEVDLARGRADDGLGGVDMLIDMSGAAGSAFADVLIGDDRDNRFDGRAGFDTLVGGAGNDWAVYEDAEQAVSVHLGAGIASDGTDNDDTTAGIQESTDELVSIEGVVGSDFDDILTGSDGNDLFVGGWGNDTIDGGLGFDGAGFQHARLVAINLSNSDVALDDLVASFRLDEFSDLKQRFGSATIAAETALVADGAEGPASTDTLISIEAVRGTESGDLFIAPELEAGQRVFLIGNGGQDTFLGAFGDEGQTIISFAPLNPDSNDFSDDPSVSINLFDDDGEGLGEGRTFGADGAEGFFYFDDIDGVVGGRQSDNLHGDDGNNYFRGGDGGDMIDGAEGFDMASYRDADNPVVVNLSGFAQNITYFDADGVNRGTLRLTVQDNEGGLWAQAWDGSSDGAEGFGDDFEFDQLQSIEGVEGGAHNDTMIGSQGFDLFLGLGGDDEFRPLGGNDTIDGGAGNDRVSYFNQSGSGVVVDLDKGVALKSGALFIDGVGFARAYDAARPIVGSWRFDAGDLGGHLGMVTFLSNGTFLFSHIGSHLEGLDGIERGTFTFNQASGAFGTTVITDQLPPEGFSHFGFSNFSISGDTLTLGGGAFGTMELQRVAEGPDGLTGAWFSMDAGEAHSIITLTFDSEGNYVVAEDGNPASDPSGNDGLEAGSYTFDGGFLHVTNTIDTNGQWGLTTIQGGNAGYSTFSLGTDQLTSIEQVFGTALGDRLTGSDDIEYTGRFTDENELFAGGPGNDTIDGGGSTDGQFDILNYAFRPRNAQGQDLITSGQNVNLGTGTASGGAGTDVIANIDMVIGSRFTDTLTGGSSSRAFHGLLFEAFRGGEGNDIINGLGGEDRVDYQDATRGVNVTLGNGINAGSATGGAGNDVLRNVEQVRGSSFSDTLSGGGTHNAGTVHDYEVFEGLEGNDIIDGKDGHDLVSFARSTGGAIVNLGSGTVEFGGFTVAAGKALDGFGTTDTLLNIEGVIGSDFDDYIQGSDANVNQTYRGGAGNDTIHGGDGNDIVQYIASASGVIVDLSAELAHDGYGGLDLLSGIEGVRGSVFDDALTGSSGDNLFSGLRGNDTIDGGDGNDVLDYSRDEQYGGMQGIAINLATGTATDGFGDTDTFTSIERVIATRFADSITGGAADEDLEGGAGNDTIEGGDGIDRLVFTNAQAAVSVNFELGEVDDGTDQNLAVAGIQQGRDTFSGIEGAVGTAFNDSFTLATGLENIDGGAGNDTVITRFTFSLLAAGANIENLTLTGTDSITGTGNDGANVITGNVGNNTLNGGGGNDTVSGNDGNDSMLGGDGRDLLAGGNGDDTLNGGAGIDTLAGGQGSDLYIVNSSLDVIQETGTVGTDRVQLTADFTVGAADADFIYNVGGGIEDVQVLGGGSSITLNGNALNNLILDAGGNSTLRGNAGNDTLDGGEGDDVMEGGVGNDTYRVRSLTDQVKELANQGIDTIEVALATYQLGDNFENLILLNAPEIQIGRGNKLNNYIKGNDFNNLLFGDLGNDTLEGGGGNDQMFGGAGSDSYIISGADIIVEVGGSTADQALAAVNLDLTNVSGIENATAIGTGDVGIVGNKLNNQIFGNSGSNVLNGGAGSDTLAGGSGNDVYVVQGTGDKIVEAAGAAGGTDELQTDFTFSLAQLPTIENLTLVGGGNINGTGNAAANVILGYQDSELDPLGNPDPFFNLSGNNSLSGAAGNDTLDGGAGDDTLEGGAGNDLLIGGDGNDVYGVDSLGDRVRELGSGTDEVRSTQTIDLTGTANDIVEDDALDNIENVTLLGAAAVNAIGNEAANVLTGNAGKNSLSGGIGDDTLAGLLGNDTLSGGDGNDLADYAASTKAVNVNLTAGTASGGAGADVLTSIEQVRGSKFNDTLVGGAGASTLEGGLGNDIYIVTDAGHVVTELDGQGIDTVRTTLGGTLADALENMELLPALDPVNATGNAAANKLTGNDGDNELNGLAGADTMAGLRGNDTYYVDSTGDVVTESVAGVPGGTDSVISTVTYTLTANVENLTLGGSANINGTGNAFANVINGNSGDNVLNGLGGADSMEGGGGNDTFFVDNPNDNVIGGAGLDVIFSKAATFTMHDTIEHLTLEAGGGSAEGNGLANRLTGNAGANTLSGLGGNDTISGGAGADNLSGGDDTDVLTYAGTSGAVNVNLDTGRSTGAGGNDTLSSFEHVIGTNANDTLAGSAGVVTLEGGLGNDRYVLFDSENVVIELDGQGIDTIVVGFDVVSLDDALENVELKGAGDFSATGNLSANRLTGDAGSDTLDGAFGADTMAGLGGDDIYYVDNAGDVVSEAVGGGNDTIVASVSYTLSLNVEDLTLSDEVGDIDATGNTLNNVLTGNSSNNVLDGKAGADTMIGDDGDDVYVVDSLADRVNENGGTGIDEVRSAVTINLTNGEGVVVSFLTVEHVTLTGNAAADAIGNDLDNILAGNAGANSISGGNGDDTISGGAGADTLSGGDGTDVLTYAGTAGAVKVDLLAGRATGGAGTDALSGFEHVIGGNGADSLTGDAGNETLDGGAGADTLVGGEGDDVYVVDSLADRVRETGAGTADEVWSSVSISLAAAGIVEAGSLGNIERIVLLGNANLSATGNVLDNIIIGNDGDNLLDGAFGNDTLFGGAGRDIAVYANVAVNFTGNLETGVVGSIAAADELHDIEGIIAGSGNDSLVGNDADNIFRGGAGNDTMSGGAGNDTLDYSTGVQAIVVNLGLTTVSNDGLGGVDEIDGFEAVIGGSGGDTLIGTGGNETLDGGLGADSMSGGGGNDVYFVDNGGDMVVEGEDQGTDQVFATVSHTLAANVEYLTLLGAAAAGIGNALDNAITGNALANTLTGNDGDDTLDGGAGSDTMIGGEGGDLYMVDAAGDRVRETGTDEGVDEIRSTVTVSLSAAGVVEAASLARIENIMLLGAANVNATGNALGNVLTGNDGNNVLDGKAGGDEMAGGLGNDTYVVDNAEDDVSEDAAEGTDLVQASVSWTLSANVENLLLTGNAAINGTGNALSNMITGNVGANVLDGGAGADTMTGGNGNDTYILDSEDDVVVEAIAGVGANRIDTIVSAFDFDLGQVKNVENLTLTGAALAGTGNAAANLIVGNDEDNMLTGLAGNDTLDGGAGADTLAGGAGGDVYVIDTLDDVVQDTVAGAAGGVDTLQSGEVSVDLSLAEHAAIENGRLTGDAVLNLTGNALKNLLTGNDGHNVLDGRAGVDTLVGGLGNDTYIVDSLADVITEAANGGTGDTIQVGATISLSGKYANLENVDLQGAGNFNATGNAAANALNGNAGNNVLLGLAGDDVLYGAEGNDTLDGGAGADEMTGSIGDDRFIFDHAGDQAMEDEDEGTDTVVSSLATTELGENLENLELTGTAVAGIGNDLANRITGNAQANTLEGGGGNDTLNGGAGNDTLVGGDGDDRFIFDIADGIIDGGAGNDGILVTTAFPGAAKTLDLTTMANLDARFESIERIDLSGPVGANNTLKFTVQNIRDMLDLEEDGLFYIDGGVFDKVDSQGQGWEFVGGTSIGDTLYFEYHFTVDGDLLQLRVAQDLTQLIS